jgi:hypothetical protein
METQTIAAPLTFAGPLSEPATSYAGEGFNFGCRTHPEESLASAVISQVGPSTFPGANGNDDVPYGNNACRQGTSCVLVAREAQDAVRAPVSHWAYTAARFVMHHVDAHIFSG